MRNMAVTESVVIIRLILSLIGLIQGVPWQLYKACRLPLLLFEKYGHDRRKYRNFALMFVVCR